MGGVKLAKNVNIVNHNGVQYPLAFMGNKVAQVGNYPNFNNTIYWNPVVEIAPGENFEFNCVKPQYQGKFKLVIEGIDSNGEAVYTSTVFTIE